jgi:hypothetical protein
LQWRGLTSEEVTRATYYEAVYQTVARSALRDPDRNRSGTAALCGWGVALDTVGPG